MKNPPTRNAVAAFTLKLGRLQKWAVYSVFAALLASGLLWLAGRYGLRADADIPHPLEPLAMKLHGALTLIGMAIFGSVAPVHVRLALRLRRNLTTGLGMIGVLVFLAFSGYALYYFATEENRELVSLLHWSAGIIALALLIWHVISGRRV